MSIRFNIIKRSLLLALLIFVLSAKVSAGWWNHGPQCDDIVNREDGGYINVLTFNLLFFSEVASVETRLEPFAEFLEAQDIPVDVIFLQEVVGGSVALPNFSNSAQVLKDMLTARGLDYNLTTAFEVGLPGVFYTGNSILSRCEIKFSAVKRLSKEFEVEIFDQPVKLPRNVQMARLKIPGFGKFNAYNTHLCAFCNPNERAEQLIELFDFMDRVENFIPGVNPVLLGGDFNIDRFRNAGVENFLYQSIIDEGFVDTYAESTVDNLDHLCNYEDGPDEHCTYGVSAFDLPDGGEIGRIDYIFQRGFGVTSYGEVFFNPVVSLLAPLDYVSDHSAVLVKIQLPPS